MSPVSQIIWRNQHRIGDQNDLLLIRPTADDLAMKLQSSGHTVHAISHSYKTHTFLQQQGIESSFSVTQSDSKRKWPLVILFQPREKSLLEMMLELSAGYLQDDGELWLAGEKKSGIKSAGKRLPGHFHKHQNLDNARHCSLFAVSDPTTAHASNLSDYASDWSFQLGETTIEIASLPGIFADGRLDSGTRLLLDTLTNKAMLSQVSGRALDFGCGAGTIGIALAQLCPGLDVTLLDDSAIALEAASLTLDKNHQSARLIASNGLETLLGSETTQKFDWIVSNPPFHSGAAQELNTAHQFISDCPRLLARNGKVCIVANNHLPYRRWLQELFRNVQVIASDRGYNVWLAQHQVKN